MIAHERAVKLGETWSLDKSTLAFERAGKALRVTVKPAPPAVAEAMAGKPAKEETTVLKDGAGLVTLDAFGGSYGVSVCLDSGGENVRVASAFGLKIPMGGAAAFIVDSDLDGTLGSAGDGVVVPGSRTVGPMRSPRVEVWSARDALAVRKEPDGSWSVATLPMPHPGDGDHSAAWRQLQWQRQACGALSVDYHPELEAGMRAHGDYLARNKVMGHGETEGKPGFSTEGRDAGNSCVLGYEKRSHVDGIREQLTTLFHRTMCLAPDLSGSAMALEKGTFLTSVSKLVASPLKGKVLVYPPHGMTDVPCEFSIGGEMPMPVAGDPSPNHLGTPVGIFAMGLYRVESLPEKPAFKLVALDPSTPLGTSARGNASSVDGTLHYPGNVPAGGDRNYMGNVAFTPKSFLKPDTRYRATISVLIPKTRGATAPGDFATFAYEWEFRTGKRAR